MVQMREGDSTQATSERLLNTGNGKLRRSGLSKTGIIGLAGGSASCQLLSNGQPLLASLAAVDNDDALIRLSARPSMTAVYADPTVTLEVIRASLEITFREISSKRLHRLRFSSTPALNCPDLSFHLPPSESIPLLHSACRSRSKSLASEPQSRPLPLHVPADEGHDFFMVLARVAEYLFPAQSANASLSYLDNGEPSTATTMPDTRRAKEDVQSDKASPSIDMDLESYRPPYIHAMLAGGLGGTMGDMLMHSLDTVKTRQQGDPHMPPKYTNMGSTYFTILRQEGIWRGLYGGVTPAFLGSFSGTLIFFGCYEWSKRLMIDHGVAPSIAYLSAGFVADLAASPIYVPTEVLKTRLQLQGQHNNPFFTSGYNYRSSMHALRTIYRTEGLIELFSGYKATLFRDLPFSALQFTFYEQEQKLAKQWVGPGKDIGLPLEILTGASAGGMAGVLTCPMDVVKTRIQTELDPDVLAAARREKAPSPTPASSPAKIQHRPSSHASSGPSTRAAPSSQRPISTSGPATALKHHGQVSLDTESVIKALQVIYRTEGLGGWFRGVGPRAVWTSVQSGTMLVVYQKLLRWFDSNPLVREEEEAGLRGWS